MTERDGRGFRHRQHDETAGADGTWGVMVSTAWFLVDRSSRIRFDAYDVLVHTLYVQGPGQGEDPIVGGVSRSAVSERLVFVSHTLTQDATWTSSSFTAHDEHASMVRTVPPRGARALLSMLLSLVSSSTRRARNTRLNSRPLSSTALHCCAHHMRVYHTSASSTQDLRAGI